MYLLGFDIGGTKCAAVTASWDGQQITLLQKKRCDTDLKIGPYEMLDKLITLADYILDRTPDAIGISCGGPLDAKKGIILGPPNLPGWDKVRITEYLEQHYHTSVTLQNDANACAVAEWKFGAARGCKNAVFLTFGTGLGAGLILNSQLYDGTNGNAGEVGHLRLEDTGPVGYGKAGSFEGFCSGSGIAQLGWQLALEKAAQGQPPLYYREGMPPEEVTAKTIAEAAGAGDETAKEVYRISGEHLGKGLSVLIDTLNPEVIVIGSIFARCRELLWDAAAKWIQEEALSVAASCCRVVPAALSENIGDYAAVATALLQKKPDSLLGRYPALSGCQKELLAAENALIRCYEQGGKLLLCGNGGSAADCDHIVGELMKGFLKRRPLSEEQKRKMCTAEPSIPESVLNKLQGGLPAISLPSITALNTAFCNDVDPELVFAQPLMALGRPGDILLCISTSGNAANVAAAAVTAKALGLTVLGLTGKTGGKLKALADICICVPETETYKVQELHLPVYHHLCAQVEAHFFPE